MGIIDITLNEGNEIVRKLLKNRAEEFTDVVSNEFGVLFHDRAPAFKAESFWQMVRFVMFLRDTADEHRFYLDALPPSFGDFSGSKDQDDDLWEELSKKDLIALANSMMFDPTDTGRSKQLRPGRFIVAAACKYGDTIFVGARHFSPDMQTQIRAVREDRLLEHDMSGRAEQGFIDAQGTFLNRKEAWEIALAAGQINWNTEKEHGHGTLYSEDLYGGSWWLVEEQVIDHIHHTHEEICNALCREARNHGFEAWCPEMPKLPENMRLRDMHKIHDAMQNVRHELAYCNVRNPAGNIPRILRVENKDKFYEGVECTIAEVVSTLSKLTETPA